MFLETSSVPAAVFTLLLFFPHLRDEILFIFFANTSYSLAVMAIKKCSHAKESSWLLTGFWTVDIMTSQFLFQHGERNSHVLMLPLQVA